MKHCLLLLLGDSHLHVQHMVGGEVAAQRDFSDSPEGHADFEVFLAAITCPAYLLTDLIEEDFRLETIPHLSSGNRNSLLLRKFEQFYRGTDFHQATFLQRQKTGRRDDEMLLSALTNPALLTPWLEILDAHKIPLVGIYSVPLISAPLVEDHPSGHLLLISWEKLSGLRQTFFRDHQLQISRLTHVHNGLSFQDAVAQELIRTYQYLKSLSLLPAGQIMDVRILAHNRDMVELQAKLPQNPDMRYEFVDIAALARRHNISEDPTDSDASQIFLHQLMSKRPKIHYANTEHTRYFTLWQSGRLLNLSSIALLLAAVLWSAFNFWQGVFDAQQAASTQAQATRILNEAHTLEQALPKTSTTPADLKAAVLAYRKLDQAGPTPQEVLTRISRILDRYPRLHLDSLSWQMSSSEPAAPNTRADLPAQVISLKAHLDAFENNYRPALDYLDQFQTALAGNGYLVTVVSPPFDVSPGGSIGDQREAQHDSLTVVYKAVWRPAP